MNMTNKDQYFDKLMAHVPAFEFNSDVADVFDDMVQRSVPFYAEVHRLIQDLCRYHLKDGDQVYDLGCSTATTMCLLAPDYPQVKFIGVDNSESMIEKSKTKVQSLNHQNIELFHGDINDFKMNNAGAVIMNYTLQFIPLHRRIELIQKIYKALRPGGIFILSEKIATQSDSVHQLVTDLYYDFKRRNGYSELEISQKREALENVLVPLKPYMQVSMLESCGFKQSEMIFRWYNFASFIGIK